MATNEQERLEFFEFVRGEWGVERAAQLMELLPPVGMSELATKTDVADVRAEVAELRGDLRTEMADLRTELGTEMADQTRTLVLAMAGMWAGGIGLASAAAHFA